MPVSPPSPPSLDAPRHLIVFIGALIAIGVTFWSVLTATSGLAVGYWTYLFTRMGVGIGEASCAPAGQALIGDLYPAERRARAMGLLGSAMLSLSHAPT